MQRLTDDKHADLNPVWSPDGRTLAFVTDRGPATDFTRLVLGGVAQESEIAAVTSLLRYATSAVDQYSAVVASAAWTVSRPGMH